MMARLASQSDSIGTSDRTDVYLNKLSSNKLKQEPKTAAEELPSSPTTSTSSKTAAFFGSGGQIVRPASLSFSPESSLTSGSKDGKDAEGDVSLDGSALSRFNSWRGSQRGNGRWDMFEGKPVTPLPSPAILDESAEEGRRRKDFFEADIGHEAGGSGSRTSSRDRQSNMSSFDMSFSDSMASLPSLMSIGASTHAIPNTGSPTPASPPATSKTSSFFGTSRTVLPTSRPSTSSLSDGQGSLSNAGSIASSRRLPGASTPQLYETSRFPSAAKERDGILEGISSPSTTATPLTGTPTIRPPALPRHEENRRAAGSNAICIEVPTPTISPPSPRPEDDHSDQLPTAVSSTLLSSFASSPSKSKTTSRHVHGPSENATGSSFIPALQALQDGTKSRLVEAKGATEAFTTPANAEESEDESTGRIGRFHIEKTLGVGAFSRVALASERKQPGARRASQISNGLVALKMLEREPCMQNERMRVSWVREVEVLKHIVHPSIVRFLSSFSTPRHHVLVLESVDGGELFDLLSHHHEQLAMREWLVRLLFGELANAVGWMHSINLVHRDIKLENIILTYSIFSLEDGVRPSMLQRRPLLKISDFGLSRFVDPSSPWLETRCGSEEYAAPELIIGKRYDGRKTDVWALGVVLYALISGSLPFLSGSSAVDGTEHSSSFAKGYSRERGVAEQGALARKAHLLRIAKGDLRWPLDTNDDSVDEIQAPCPPSHRLITPSARRLVARLIRRDAAKRSTAWEAWDEDWLVKGSIPAEATLEGESFAAPLDPRREEGQAWLVANARVQSGASDIMHED